MDTIMRYLSEVAQQLGSGTEPAMIIGVSLAGFLFLVLVLFALRTSSNRSVELSRTATVIGRLEGLETTIARFRSDMETMGAQFKKESGDLREEVNRLRRAVEGGGNSGTSGGGSGPSGIQGNSGSSGPSGGGVGVAAPTKVSADVALPSTPVTVKPPAIDTGLTKTRRGFFGRIKEIFGRSTAVDEQAYEQIEEALLSADLGVRCVAGIMQNLKERVAGREIRTSDLAEAGRSVITGLVKIAPEAAAIYRPARMDGSPYVVLVVGVNGVGKTTTVAKLAKRWSGQGLRVLLVAADTFRAGAVQQLRTWSERIGVEIVCGEEGAKPSTVTYTGMLRAKELGVDVVIVDTAGRLHNKSNLMQELEGISNSVRKHFPDAPHDTVLVVDGVTGQNALQQAREFNAATKLTGTVVTKLDGSAKGGIVVAISQELQIPTYYVGVGEQPDDLIPFAIDKFTEGLFNSDLDSSNQGEQAVQL